MRLYSNAVSAQRQAFILLGAVILSLFLARSSCVAVGYQELAARYFHDRSAEFASDLTLKEQYLTILYQNAVAELRLRDQERLDAMVWQNPYWQIESKKLELSSSTSAEFSPAQRFAIWTDFEQREFQRRLNLITTLRANLIRTGDKAQNLRMFQRDLKVMLTHYAASDWELANLIMDRLLQDYPYRQVDDLLYYRSEINLQLHAFSAAWEAQQRLLREFPQSPYRWRTYDRAALTLQTLGRHQELAQLYQRYLQEGAPGDPQGTGEFHIRAAYALNQIGELIATQKALERVANASPQYLSARLLIADAFLSRGEFQSAAQTLAYIINMNKPKFFESGREIIEEAKIKLALTYHKLGNSQEAERVLETVKSSSPVYHRALLGKAWVASKQERYEAAIASAEKLLRLYPQSPEIYEAISLMGFCYDKIGEKQKAIDCFFQVLRAGSASERLQTLLAERRLLYSVLCELQALEESIFACNNESYFSDYKRIRDNVTLNLRRASLAELKEINPLFAELISERGRLDSLAWATAQIENAVLASEDNGLVVDYANHSRRISQTQRKLQALGEDQAQVCPPFYQETRLKYLNSLAQSAAESLSSEIRNLNAAITTAEQSSNTLMATETERLLRLGVQLDRLTQTLQRSHQQQAQALLAQRRAPESRIAFWSDVSFAHYSIGGMEMDELDRMRERLKQFEEDISVLENVLDIAKKQEPSQSK